MPITRKAAGEYAKVTKVKGAKQQRKPEDYDLAWAENRIYILDAHEWFDPYTSSHYENGMSRHAMVGPSLIVTYDNGSHQTYETYVNDPKIWAWIRRSIAEGYLTAETIKRDQPCHEASVKVA